jgi:predicted ABC-type ATPase
MNLDSALQELEQLPRPMLIVLAGSNGAGKSTFQRRYLKRFGYPFINADEIAKALFGDDAAHHAYEAMHIAESLRRDHLDRGVSFIMETVLSDTEGAKLAFFMHARQLGFSLAVIVIRLSDPILSMARVRQRVLEGGHDVPADKLRERFPRTLVNAAKALPMANVGLLLDNSSPETPYQLVEYWRDGKQVNP